MAQTKTKTTKTKAAKTTAKTEPKKFKLNDAQLNIAQILIDSKDGISASTWQQEGRFPTRTLNALEANGLVKSKTKKNGEGEKETFWFPTAKISKAVQAVKAA